MVRLFGGAPLNPPSITVVTRHTFMVFRLHPHTTYCNVTTVNTTGKERGGQVGVENLGKPYTIRRLSYSAASKYMECPRKFYLSRVGGLDKSTYYVTLMGTIVHHITEQADKRDTGFDYIEGEDKPEDFERMFKALVEETLNRDIEIKESGRVLKTGETWNGGPNKKDYDWCLKFGPLIIQQWVTWRTEQGLRLAVMPNQTPGVEVMCDAPMGGVSFLGYIDRVFLTDDGAAILVDLKTGNVPTKDTQLATYAYQMRALYGVEVAMAGFWGRMEGTTLDNLVFDVEHWHAVGDAYDKVLDNQIAGVANGMESGVFYGNTDSKFCGPSCAVFDYCSAVGGKYANTIPEPGRIRVLRPGETEGGAQVKQGQTIQKGGIG